MSVGRLEKTQAGGVTWYSWDGEPSLLVQTTTRTDGSARATLNHLPTPSERRVGQEMVGGGTPHSRETGVCVPKDGGSVSGTSSPSVRGQICRGRRHRVRTPFLMTPRHRGREVGIRRGRNLGNEGPEGRRTIPNRASGSRPPSIPFLSTSLGYVGKLRFVSGGGGRTSVCVTFPYSPRPVLVMGLDPFLYL